MRIFLESDVGRKNIITGTILFLVFGVGIGMPLTVDFFGGSTLGDQYQTWKIVHAYGLFLGIINYFFGLIIDRLNLTGLEKQISSWAFLITGLFGGVMRLILVFLGAFGSFAIYASLGETVFITLGSAVFLLGQFKSKPATEKTPKQPRASRDRKPTGSPQATP